MKRIIRELSKLGVLLIQIIFPLAKRTAFQMVQCTCSRSGLQSFPSCRCLSYCLGGFFDRVKAGARKLRRRLALQSLQSRTKGRWEVQSVGGASQSRQSKALNHSRWRTVRKDLRKTTPHGALYISWCCEELLPAPSIRACLSLGSSLARPELLRKTSYCG